MFFFKRILTILLCCVFFPHPRIEAFVPRDAKIWVAGHNGLVGSALVRCLQSQGYKHLILRSHQELDLCDQAAVRKFYAEEKPEYVFVAAAKVGGIWANSFYPAEFISENLAIERNIIHEAYVAGVKGLLFLGSACIYPKDCPQPIREEYLLTGSLESSNEWYAIAKICGLKLCQAYAKQYGKRFLSLMPTNLYGPGDNFDLNCSHVIPALIRKFIEAKERGDAHVIVWGSGEPLRDCLYVDDLAEAALFAMNHVEENGWLNVGSGSDLSIRDLASLIADIVEYKGEIVFDPSKPDGVMRRVLDISKMKELGWSPKVSLREGLQKTILWFKHHQNEARLSIEKEEKS